MITSFEEMRDWSDESDPMGLKLLTSLKTRLKVDFLEVLRIALNLSGLSCSELLGELSLLRDITLMLDTE